MLRWFSQLSCTNRKSRMDKWKKLAHSRIGWRTVDCIVGTSMLSFSRREEIHCHAKYQQHAGSQRRTLLMVGQHLFFENRLFSIPYFSFFFLHRQVLPIFLDDHSLFGIVSSDSIRVRCRKTQFFPRAEWWMMLYGKSVKHEWHKIHFQMDVVSSWLRCQAVSV